MSYRAEEAARKMQKAGVPGVPTPPIVPVVPPVPVRVEPVVRPVNTPSSTPLRPRTVPIPVEQLGKDAEHNIESPVYIGPDLTTKPEVGTLVEPPVKPVR